MTAGHPTQSVGISTIIYGVYVWFEFALAVLLACIASICVPGLERRRRWVACCGRTSLRLAGISTRVRGLEKLPDGHCVVVANHASYLDGVLLQAFLPSRFAFVVKGEMRKFPLVSVLLRRVGCRFVERFEASASARDARQLVKAASAGESLAVFPEGTFVATPGLGRFRAGAFAAAIRSGAPIVPVVISGSRHILPTGALLPRYGHVRIDVLHPIDASHSAYESSKDLAALARARILEILDEPDLLRSTSTETTS